MYRLKSSKSRWVEKIVAGAVFNVLVVSLVWGQNFGVSRDEFGKPNFTGQWNFNDTTPFERPIKYGKQEFLTTSEFESKNNHEADLEGRRDSREQGLSERVINIPTGNPGAYNNFWSYYQDNFPNQRTSILVSPENGRLPIKAESEVQLSPPHANGCNTGQVVPLLRPVRISFGAITCDRPEDFGLASRCLLFPQTTGPYIKANSYNNNIRIVVTAGYVVLYSELGNDPRIVPLGKRPHLDKRQKTWTGNSFGYWEQDVLVIETKDFVPKMASVFMRNQAIGSAANMQLIERFSLVDDDSMAYEFTIKDKVAFSEDVRGITHFARMSEAIFEFACHEGNYALTNMLKAARIMDVGLATGQN